MAPAERVVDVWCVNVGPEVVGIGDRELGAVVGRQITSLNPSDNPSAQPAQDGSC